MVTNDERWCDHCLEMAEATRTLAEACADPAMMHAYLDLAAEWVRLSSRPVPAENARLATLTVH